jgi:hypothetical protein
MAFYTKVDYSRQLKQKAGTTATFSGSTQFYQEFSVQTSTEFIPEDDCPCFGCSTGATFIVGDYSATSASCNVTITSFSGQTGITQVLAIGQVPINPLSGGTGAFYLTGSSLQIDRNTLLDSAAMTGEVALLIDEAGNVVRTAPSSLRYKKDLVRVEPNRYRDMLKQIHPYFFTYKSSGAAGFGLIAEELDRLGYRELVIYDSQGRPDNIDYRLLSVALLRIIKDLEKPNVGLVESDNHTKVVNEDYVTNGEYLLVVNGNCNITLNSKVDKKIKIKSLSSCTIVPDKNKIDNKWESIELSGDSCVEFVFVKDLDCWVISSSDGIKDS